MLLHRRVARPAFKNASKALQNRMTSPLAWFYSFLPAGWAVVFCKSTVALMFGFALAVFTYAVLCARLTQFRWCLRPETLRSKTGFGQHVKVA